MQATQEKNRVTNEINELKDHVDIKDRKINVLQRKVCTHLDYYTFIIYLLDILYLFLFIICI